MRASTFSRPALLALALSITGACGARTEITSPPPAPPCKVDADCAGHDDLCNPVHCGVVLSGTPAAPEVACVKGTPVNCNDGDPCTVDTCLPASGGCAYAHITPDQDGDGYYAPLPGTVAGAPGSCGNDCDDSNPNIHPGAVDVCGQDDNCDGVFDDTATYLPGPPDVRVSGPIAPASADGIACSGQSYAATYTGTNHGFNVYLSLLDAAGAVQVPPGEEVYTLVDADASGGPILWIGDRYGTAWQDRRTGNYNIYFSWVDVTGAKKIADVPLTNQSGFSVNPELAWNGQEYLVVWQDDREGPFHIFGQRVGADGTLDGGNVQLTSGEMGLGDESPSVAPGLGGAAIAWGLGDATQHVIAFQVFSTDLTTPLSPPVNVTDGTTEAVFPVVIWSTDRYVVAWYDESASPEGIYAATFGPDGTPIAPAQPITHPGAFQSRYPALKSLGDRILMVYADDRDQNQGYELYTLTFNPDLTPATAETRVTYAPGDSVFPFITFGPGGDIGILFRDDREGEEDVFFTSLACSM
jgi:hypothetical protein